MKTEKKDFKLLIFLIFLTLLIVVFGYGHIKGTIYNPFTQPINQSDKITMNDLTEEQIFNVLSQQDTDKDGLSDFDEKFVYQTSAYIADSDSDMFTDKEEIDAQSDPLDPLSTPYHKPKPESKEKSKEESNITKPENPINNNEKLSIQEIKDLLINEAGLGSSIVDNIDDKTLIKLYNETKEETGIDLKDLKASESLENQPTNLDISRLDISQLRQLLIDEGADKEMLDSVDDAILEQMFKQSLLNF